MRRPEPPRRADPNPPPVKSKSSIPHVCGSIGSIGCALDVASGAGYRLRWVIGTRMEANVQTGRASHHQQHAPWTLYVFV